MAMPRHIEQRRLGWYAVLNVPTDVQKKIGKKRFRMSLKTRDKKAAERLAKPLIAVWEQQIALARDEKAARSAAAVWRDTLRRATTDKERDFIKMMISDEADDIGFFNVDPGQAPSSDPEARPSCLAPAPVPQRAWRGLRPRTTRSQHGRLPYRGRDR